MPGVSPGHHTPPALFLQQILISYIQRESHRNPLILGRYRTITLARDSLGAIVGTGSEVNLIKYQPELIFLCDSNAYYTHYCPPPWPLQMVSDTPLRSYLLSNNLLDKAR